MRSWRITRWFVCGLLCWCAGVPGPARADSFACTTQPDYLATIERALSDYQGHRFQVARALFAKAHVLCPSARTLRGLGLSAFELGLYPEAAELLRGALTHPTRPLDGALRAATTLLLARAQGLLATLRLTTSPGSALARIDGLAVMPAPDGTLELAVGAHLLELSALGHLAQRVPLDARAGESITLHIALPPMMPHELEPRSPKQHAAERSTLAPQSTTRASTSPGSSPGRVAGRRERWLWTGLGALGVATALSLGFGLTARHTDTSPAISAPPIATRAGP